MLSQSGLLTAEQMRTVEKRFAVVAGRTDALTQDIIVWLLKHKLITPWHAEKLIQGRFRGFSLGPYKLLNRVARGGMSTIYSAEDRDTGEICALKVLPLSKTKKASYLQRFQREATITQRLNHPNIVRVFGVFSGTDGQDDVHFMAMELLQGRDLFEVVNENGPLPCRLAANLICQAAKGLHYAHQAGLVHRDIKPGNLFLSDDKTVRILDLGLAQDFDSEENLTRDFNERVLGTADYLSPEQAADSHTVDARADVYSLGCSLYFLLTGQPPFTEGTLVQRLIAHQTKTPPAVSEFRSDVPDDLTGILAGMMEKSRDNRTATAKYVAEQLEAFLTRTVGENALDSTPQIRKLSPTINGSGRETEDLENADGSEPGPRQTTEDATNTANTIESGEQGILREEFLPEFTSLLKRIEADCDEHGALYGDRRSARLLALSKELLQTVAAVEPAPEGVTVAIQDPSTSAVEVTVLNDVLPSEREFDLKAIQRRFAKENASKHVIDELLAAVEEDPERLASESSVPILQTIQSSRHPRPRRSENQFLFWGFGAISIIAVVALALALMYAW